MNRSGTDWSECHYSATVLQARSALCSGLCCSAAERIGTRSMCTMTLRIAVPLTHLDGGRQDGWAHSGIGSHCGGALDRSEYCAEELEAYCRRWFVYSGTASVVCRQNERRGLVPMHNRTTDTVRANRFDRPVVRDMHGMCRALAGHCRAGCCLLWLRGACRARAPILHQRCTRLVALLVIQRIALVRSRTAG